MTKCLSSYKKFHNIKRYGSTESQELQHNIKHIIMSKKYVIIIIISLFVQISDEYIQYILQ